MEVFYICFDKFRDIAKTGKIARRPGESIKMEGPGGQEWHQNQKNASKFASKFEAENHSNIDPTWKQNGAKIEQKGIEKSMFF